MPRGLKVSHEEFIRVWQSSESVREVAQRTGLSRAQCYNRAKDYRYHDVVLKDFKKGHYEPEMPGWEVLRKLAKMIYISNLLSELLDDSH